MRTRTDSIIAAISHGIVMVIALAPLAATASDSMQGTLQEYIIDYPAEEGESGAPEHDGAAAQTGEMPEVGRPEYVYLLQRDDGTEVRLQGEEALAPYSSGDRVSVQGRIVSADGAEGPARMAVRSVKPLSNQQGTVARQSTAADHGEDGIEKRRVLGIVVDFDGSETDISLDDVRNDIWASNTSSDALFRINSGGDADGGGQLGFFPPKGNGPAVTRVDLDFSPVGCDIKEHVQVWADAADKAARNQGIDFSKHQHTVYYLSRDATRHFCDWTGAGEVGCDGGCRAWTRVKGNANTAHILGHNVGLRRTYKLEGVGRGPQKHGEPTLMAYLSGVHGYINPPQREFLGWYDDHPDLIRQVEGGEQKVTIAGLSADYDSSLPQTVKVPVDDSDRAYYAYLADEDPLGDNSSGPFARNSVLITRRDAGKPWTIWYAQLGPGDQYRDEERGVVFTVDSTSSSEATLRVQNGDELFTEDIAWTMAPGQTHEGTLEASKPGDDAEPSFQKADNASQGQAQVDSDGSFTYTASSDAEGSDTFTFQASAAGQTDKGTAEITFNQPPQVEPLELTVAPDGSVEETLPASDAESAIEDVALTITEPPQKGTIKGPKDDGSFTYTADEGESGTDTFRYTAGDAYSESKPAEVTVTIQGDNGADSGSAGSDDSDSGGSGDGSSGGDSGGGGGGAVGWLSLLALLGGMLVASRRRLATAVGGTHA